DFHVTGVQTCALPIWANPDKPAFIMAGTGKAVSYGELERRSNRLAHLLRRQGLQRFDHYAIFMENNERFIECCSAGDRSGLYYTTVNSYLKADELAYILQNRDRKSTRLNSSHVKISYAVFC